MAKEYLTIHTSAKSLAQDATQLVDKYVARQVDEEALGRAVSDWMENCPNLLFSDETRSAISGSVLRYIGKKRAAVLMAAMKQHP